MRELKLKVSNSKNPLHTSIKLQLLKICTLGLRVAYRKMSKNSVIVKTIPVYSSLLVFYYTNGNVMKACNKVVK